MAGFIPLAAIPALRRAGGALARVLLARDRPLFTFIGAEALAMRGFITMVAADRGFGFIRDGEGKDWFFHATGVRGFGFKRLAEGDAVEFAVEQSDRGPRATDVQLARL